MTESFPPDMRLASEPGQWQVTLSSGELIQLLAHGFSIEEDQYVFSLLIEGTPAFEVDVMRIPVSIVRSVEGG